MNCPKCDSDNTVPSFSIPTWKCLDCGNIYEDSEQSSATKIICGRKTCDYWSQAEDTKLQVGICQAKEIIMSEEKSCLVYYSSTGSAIDG